jgi:hypothetical protein
MVEAIVFTYCTRQYVCTKGVNLISKFHAVKNRVTFSLIHNVIVF